MTSEKLKQQLRRLILHKEAQKYAIARLDGSEVKYPHQSDYLTESNLDSAISGVSTGSQFTLHTIGIMLAQDKTGLTKAGCIDIDTPRDAENMTAGYALAQRLQQTAKNWGLNAYIEFSRNRGYHLWIFSKTAITASLMQSCLRAIALQADFEALEIFPNSIPESKCIKLPCTVHLKSSKRCGFIDGRFNPLAPSVSLDNQASLMAEFKQNTLEAIARLANSESPNQNQAKSKNRFGSFGDSQPSCINHLIAKGAPLELEYNLANVTLARYCLEREYDLSFSTKLASQMAKNTPESHPTKKDYQGKIKNFRGAFKSAYRKGYEFSCSYALARLGDKPLASRGCIGTQCPACDWSSNGKSPVTHTKMPYNRLISQAMVNLSSEGKECCKSAIMCEVEKLSASETNPNQPSNLTDGEALQEQEAIAYLLQNREHRLDIPVEGYQGKESENLSDYLDYLFSLSLPSPETIETNFSKIRERGIKAIAHNNALRFTSALTTEEPVGTSLERLINDSESLLKQSLNNRELSPMITHLGELTENLFSKDLAAIPSPSPHLNNVLNGGFMAGKLHVIGAPPGNGKSTLCAWCGDYAASLGVKVIYASYEMSREQLWIASLARLGQLNSAVIEARRFLQSEYEERRLLDAIASYKSAIASNMTVIEADITYTPAKLKAIVKKLDADLLVVDYLQLLQSGDQKLDNTYQETLRVSRIATELKRVARDTGAAVIAISDINKAAHQSAVTGGELDMGALRDSFKIAHSADVIQLLQSGVVITGKGESKTKLDQLQLLAHKYPEKQRVIDRIREDYPINHNTADTYSRLTIVKNRGGKLGEPVFKYSRALHDFVPLDFQVEINPDSEDI